MTQTGKAFSQSSLSAETWRFASLLSRFALIALCAAQDVVALEVISSPNPPNLTPPGTATPAPLLVGPDISPGLLLPPDDAPDRTTPGTSAAPRKSSLSGQAPAVRGAVGPPNIGGGVWLDHGPGPSINGQVENISPNNEVSGAIHTVAAHPTNPDILYAGGANGGIWKTTNGTSASPFWTPQTDTQMSLSIGALEFDPTDGTHSTLAAGVGRFSSFGLSGGVLTGLLRTTNGGSTWTSIGAGLAGGNITGVAPRGATIVTSLDFHETLTCGNVGIWRSTNSGASFTKLTTGVGIPDGVAFDLAGDPTNSAVLYTGITFGFACTGSLPNGIYKSTDTGATWTKVSTAAVDALIVDITTNNIEIAANGSDVFVNIVQNGQTAGIFHSANGGTSWTAMDLPVVPQLAPQPITSVTPGTPITIDTSPSNHNLVTGNLVEILNVGGTTGANGIFYVTFVSPTTFTLNGSSDGTAYTSGGTWGKLSGLNPRFKPGGQGGIHASIRAHPTTPSTVFIGGDRQDSPFPNFIGAVDFSGNLTRGDTLVAAAGTVPSPQWEHLTHSNVVAGVAGGGTASSSSPHADSREMVFDANGNIIEGDDGGIYRRTSPGSNTGDWFSINGNIQTTEIHDVAYDSVSNVIISGNQDTGTTQQPFPFWPGWNSVSTADGGDVAVDDTTTAGMSVRYSSNQFLGGFRRRTYDADNVLQGQVFPTLSPNTGSTVSPLFTTPVVLNTLAPTRLAIAGSNGVFESLDQGDTIDQVVTISGAVPPTVGIAYGGISGAVNNLDVLYITVFNLVGVRTAAFPSAPVISAYPGPVTANILDVVLDPNEWMNAFIVDDQNKVYMTANAGTSWTDITGNLTDTQLRTIEYLPGAMGPDRVAVGGRDGVFVLDLPAAGPYNWGELGIGLPQAPVWDLEFDPTDGVLVAGTLGRGAWQMMKYGACGATTLDTLVLHNRIITASEAFEACTTLIAGPTFHVDGPASTQVDFSAGSSIVLYPGFGVANGNIFTATISGP